MVNKHISSLLKLVLFVFLSSYVCRASWTINNTLPTMWYQTELDCITHPESSSNDCKKNSECHQNNTTCSYSCSYFKQRCFNKTSTYICEGYNRECLKRNSADDGAYIECSEYYDKCTVTVDQINTPLKAPAPGIPAKVYPYCIPGIISLRDRCNATLSKCNSTTKIDQITGRPSSCSITCEVHTSDCINYTRQCSDETLTCENKKLTKQCKVDKDFNCDITVTTRTERYAMDLYTKYDKRNPLKYLKHYIDVELANYEDTVDLCVEHNEVPYNLECNYMGGRAMSMFAPVVYEGRAYDAINGVRAFLAEWDVGYTILCRKECWYHLIKRSRACWPQLPLQYFLPGSDYRTFELFIRNTTDMMCYRTPPPVVKYEGDMDFMNRGNSCVTFFDPTHRLTVNHTVAVRKGCSGEQEQGKCSESCNKALADLKTTFGCCIGMIIRQFDFAKGWLSLVNFDNNFMLLMLKRCTSAEDTKKLTDIEACDKLTKFSLVVEIVKYLMYVLGAVMGVGIVAMTISFYWQLEHEPLKKEFYHF